MFVVCGLPLYDNLGICLDTIVSNNLLDDAFLNLVYDFRDSLHSLFDGIQSSVTFWVVPLSDHLIKFASLQSLSEVEMPLLSGHIHSRRSYLAFPKGSSLMMWLYGVHAREVLLNGCNMFAASSQGRAAENLPVSSSSAISRGSAGPQQPRQDLPHREVPD